MTASQLRVEILRWADDSFPGFVECQIVDLEGASIRFIEKAPIVTSVALSAASVFPQSGYISCLAVVRHTGGSATADVELPSGVVQLSVSQDDLND